MRRLGIYRFTQTRSLSGIGYFKHPSVPQSSTDASRSRNSCVIALVESRGCRVAFDSLETYDDAGCVLLGGEELIHTDLSKPSFRIKLLIADKELNKDLVPVKPAEFDRALYLRDYLMKRRYWDSLSYSVAKPPGGVDAWWYHYVPDADYVWKLVKTK